MEVGLGLRSPFRLPVTATCQELRDDKRYLLITIRAALSIRKTRIIFLSVTQPFSPLGSGYVEHQARLSFRAVTEHGHVIHEKLLVIQENTFRPPNRSHH
jgi:hypothetical protein